MSEVRTCGCKSSHTVMRGMWCKVETEVQKIGNDERTVTVFRNVNEKDVPNTCKTALAALFIGIMACSGSQNKAALDINALETSCVEVSATRETSRDCRNAVRRAWAKANGVTIVDLDGGSNE